jgi:four helix bundle protein
MQPAQRFEDLWIWQEARVLVRRVYSDCRNGPARKDFAFRDQMVRAGLSVMSNIAEGFERSTDADFARFLDLAKGSSGEVRSLYYVAEDLGYVSSEYADDARSTVRRVAAGISRLTAHLRRKVR